MQLAEKFGTTCRGLGTIAFLVLANGLIAAPLYTYTYSGPAFTVFENNSTELPPITSGNVIMSLTLDEPILSNGMLTDYDSDITSWYVSDGQETLDSGNAGIDAYFGTTNGAITDWTVTATGHNLQPNENYFQIDSESNTGILNPNESPFYSDISLNMDNSGNFSQGKASGLGQSPSSFQSAPEPSTEAMVFLGMLPFLVVYGGRKFVRHHNQTNR